MARSLNKKYFGNRNIGTTGTADNGIGGEGIASISWSDRGSWLSTAGGAAAPLAGLALPAPTLPGGVQATWTNYFGAAAVTTGAGSVGLVVGETYTYAPIPGLLVTVATSTNNGTNATFTVTTAGSTTTLLTDLQTVNLTKSAGMTGAATFAVDIQLKIVDTVIGEKGSGYTGAETFTVTTANSATGTAPVGTIVLTTDSAGYDGNGARNVTTNQENAIQISAYVPAVDGGSSAVAGDIIRQVSGRRYKVKTAQGTGIVKLVAAAPAAGQATITATDSGGATYYVTKLTAHKALLTSTGSGTPEFADGTSVKWTFGSAVTDSSVTIANA